MTVLIYTDNVSNNHILYWSLGRLLGKQNVYFVNASEILAGALTPDVDLFVMPGGASRYKSDKLNGRGCELIKEYVASGGRYLGICAGAYMACEHTIWAKDSPFEIVTGNELAFFPGTAEGPAEAFGRGDNYNATRARVVTLDVGGNTEHSLYLGGCVFKPETNSGYEVLARFGELPDKPAAIVAGQYGKGQWVLSSTHPEYDQEAVELMSFDVIGNEYEEYKQVSPHSELNLDLLEYLLNWRKN